MECKILRIFLKYVSDHWSVFFQFAWQYRKSHIWENFCSWYVSQNVLSQSDNRIFLINHVLRISQWYNLIFSMSTQIHINWKLSKYFGVAMVKNGSGQCGPGTLRLTLSQKWMDGMNWFFECLCKFRKAIFISIIFGWIRSKMGVAV